MINPEVANELLAAEGKSVVLSGSNNQDTQLLVIAINEMLGNMALPFQTTSRIHSKRVVIRRCRK